MRFVYLMDPVDRVLPDKDTTFAFLRASHKRGHRSFHCEARHLYIKDGDVFARVRALTVSDTAPHFTFEEPVDLRLADVEAVFIRKDPPFDSQYLYATLMLERLRGRTTVINDPRGLRDANEKLYALHFAHHMPRTLVACDRERILAFVDEVGGTGVIKPLEHQSGVQVLGIEGRILADEDGLHICQAEIDGLFEREVGGAVADLDRPHASENIATLDVEIPHLTMKRAVPTFA